MDIEELKIKSRRDILRLKVVSLSIFIGLIFWIIYMFANIYWPVIHDINVTYRTSDNKYYYTVSVEPAHKAEWQPSRGRKVSAAVYNHSRLIVLFRDVRLQHLFNGVEEKIYRCTEMPSLNTLQGFFLNPDRLYWKVPMASCEDGVKHRVMSIDQDLKNTKELSEAYRHGRKEVERLAHELLVM